MLIMSKGLKGLLFEGCCQVLKLLSHKPFELRRSSGLALSRVEGPRVPTGFH